MDDLFEQWQYVDKKSTTIESLSKTEIMNAIYQKSTGTMEELKKRLKYKINWIITIGTGIAIFMLFHISNPGVVLGSALVLSYYIYGYTSLTKYHKKMGANISGFNALQAMQHNYTSITEALKSEERVGRFFFPIVVGASLIVSGSLKGLSLIDIVTNTKFLTVFAIAVLVVIPAISYLAGKMNDTAYGPYISDLKRKIERIQQV